MKSNDLQAFGEKLRELRTRAGFYQAELVERLSQIHARVDPKTDLRLDGNRISKWERAFVGSSGREWKPRRQYMLYLIEVFADLLSMESARDWAALAGYRISAQELEQILSARSGLFSFLQPPPLPVLRTTLQRLELFSQQRLFGIDREQEQLRLILEQTEAPWLIAVDGLGGIGKTSLANAVARELAPTGRFFDVAWVSAKQEEFLPGRGLQKTDRPALDAETLTDILLEQLHPHLPPTGSTEEKRLILAGLLKQQPYLIVIDNLETVVDYEALLPLLRQLANPSKFLLTSRVSLPSFSNIFCLSLQELSRADTLNLLEHEAQVRGLTALAAASPAQLASIYEVTGGNPLALKLVIGQINFLPLSKVLENLKQARGQKADELYTYIYWQAWRRLDPAGRQVLLSMPLAQGGNLAQITALCELEKTALDRALEHLTTLSLVEVSGDIEQRRYRIHRLTETFLLKEVIKWD